MSQPRRATEEELSARLASPPSPTWNEARENELVARVQAGDNAAFETLFRSWWEPLYNYAFRFLHSADEAEDAVQGVFTRIWNRRAEWTVTPPVSRYLYLAVRNAACDRLRRDAVARQWREKRVEALRQESKAGITLRDRASGSVDGADAFLLESELEATYERALAELTPKQREAYLLCSRDGLTYVAIAERMKVSVKTVETHMTAAYKHLRRRVKD